MNAKQWFDGFFAEVRKTDQWRTMEGIVEDSPWHREANVATHTTMCIDFYFNRMVGAEPRPDRQQILTAMTLLFHDFGKPEAQEVKEKKDGSGDVYRSYAGHESVSANEFLSFMMSHEALTQSFFDQGFGWEDIRKIKWMIQNHLPFGIKNATKRADLKAALINTLGVEDEWCFYDQLWADCNGRISDDHEAKREAVLDWIAEFRRQEPSKARIISKRSPVMYVLVGPVGAGKSTWTEHIVEDEHKCGRPVHVVCEDTFRIEFAVDNMTVDEVHEWLALDRKVQYAQAWQYCFDNSSEYDAYARAKLLAALATGDTVILDRTNQTRKSRSRWIAAAKAADYWIQSVEFYVSEQLSHERQQTREDKEVPDYRVHQIYMAFDVPAVGVEVDSFEIVPTFSNV